MEAETGQPDDPAKKRAEMLEAISNGVADEDYEFVIEIADAQDDIQPFELVEYMNVKRQHAEDPVEARRWGDALHSYLATLQGKEFPEEEAEAINAVIGSLEFDRVVNNEELAVEPEYEEQEQSERRQRPGDEDDIDWRSDKFEPEGLDPKELKRLASTPIGKSVVVSAKKAIFYTEPKYLGAAQNAIDSFQFGSSSKLQMLLDTYVNQCSEKIAQKAVFYTDPNYLKTALKTIETYASGEETAYVLEKCIDKYSFNLALNLVKKASFYNDNSYVKKAIQVIDQYVSSEARIRAMLDELGLA